METWQQWATAAVTFLMGLASVYAALRLTGRKDNRADADLTRESRADAIKEWRDYCARREKFHDADKESMRTLHAEEKKSLLDRIAHQDKLIEDGRKEVHDLRDDKYAAQMQAAVLMEEVKHLRAELAESRTETADRDVRAREAEEGGHKGADRCS